MAGVVRLGLAVHLARAAAQQRTEHATGVAAWRQAVACRAHAILARVPRRVVTGPRVVSFERVVARASVPQAGVAGEEAVTAVLRAHLPADYVVLNNVRLRRGFGDLNHDVVGPTGVFLLETKHWSGTARYRDGTWRRTNSRRAGGALPVEVYRDPFQQLAILVPHLRWYLRETDPTPDSRPVRVHGAVVFSHPRLALQVTGKQFPVLRLEELASYLTTPRARSLQPERVAELAARLEAAGRRTRRVVSPSPGRP